MLVMKKKKNKNKGLMLRVQAILTAMMKMMTLKVLIHGGDENDGDDVSTDHDDGGMKDANHQNSVDGLRKSQGSGSDSHTRVIVPMKIPLVQEFRLETSSNQLWNPHQ